MGLHRRRREVNGNELLDRLKGLGADVDPQAFGVGTASFVASGSHRLVGRGAFRSNGQKLTLSSVNIGRGGVRVESAAAAQVRGAEAASAV